MASKALREQNSPSQMSETSDSISRQSVSDLFDAWEAAELDHHIPKILRDRLKTIPSAQPELTDDRAIEHLQSTGWMQNHDKEMYEMGLRERIADDSSSYDSLIPSGDTILRQDAIDALCSVCGVDCDKSEFVYGGKQEDQVILCPEHYALTRLPSAQPEPHWIPVSERLPEDGTEVLVYLFDRPSPFVAWIEDTRWYTEEFEVERENDPIAWMPLPKPYGGDQDG